MSDATATTESLDVPCPECGQRPVKLVKVGDPEKATPVETFKQGNLVITVFDFFAFANCTNCKHSWELPAVGSA